MAIQVTPSDSTSQELAELIVDAMKDGGVVAEENFESGVAIATEEIDARKAIGDYWCSRCPNQEPVISDSDPDDISETRGKILWANLRPFVSVLAQLAHYPLTEDEWTMISKKVAESDCTLEPPRLVDYKFHAHKRIRVWLGLDSGNDTIEVHLSLPSSRYAQANLAMDIMSRYRLHEPSPYG